MFGKFKEKLNYALQEGLVISESLQEQYRLRATNNNTTATSACERDTQLLHVDASAGCALLAKYEADWRQIAQKNAANARSAEQIATQISDIEQHANAQANTLNDLSVNLAGIPALLTSLQQCERSIEQVALLSQTVEIACDELQDLCDECELQDFMLQKQHELLDYKRQKMAKLETFRRNVEAEHNVRLRQREQQLEHIQRERQAVFEHAFQADLEEYKQRGAIEKLAHATAADPTALEDVLLDDVDETKVAYERFLAD